MSESTRQPVVVVYAKGKKGAGSTSVEAKGKAAKTDEKDVDVAQIDKEARADAVSIAMCQLFRGPGEAAA